MHGINLAYLDGACHPEFTAVFEIQEDELPALIHIDAKFEKYARMIGRLESSYISAFFSKIKGKRATYRGYDKLAFESRDCEFERDKMEKVKE
jgi:hypothetical protein